MMIKCGECRKNVSQRAKACPNCGEPIINKTVDLGSQHEYLGHLDYAPTCKNSKKQHTVLIEFRAKSIKKLMVYGVLAIIAGFFPLVFIGMKIAQTGSEIGGLFVYGGIAMSVCGVLMLVFAQSWAWWEHS